MAGAFRKFAVYISTSTETTPKARNAYSVGKTAPKSPSAPLESRHAIAPATSPQKEEIVRAPGATSSRVPHFGQSTPNENAATMDEFSSVLQCGQMRTATAHLSVGTHKSNRIPVRKKCRKAEKFGSKRQRLTATRDPHIPSTEQTLFPPERERHGAHQKQE
jgi:hypothetical protein